MQPDHPDHHADECAPIGTARTARTRDVVLAELADAISRRAMLHDRLEALTDQTDRALARIRTTTAGITELLGSEALPVAERNVARLLAEAAALQP